MYRDGWGAMADNAVGLSMPVTAQGVARADGGATARAEQAYAFRALRHVVVLAGAVAVVVAVVILVGLDGWHYYTTPLRVRGYLPAHQLLRPSGSIGRSLGIAGAALMLAMHLYSLRKRRPRMLRFGSLPWWLEFHIFCGVLGPVLITFHTSFRFNGLVSVAYWSMVLVFLSGFVGRYLYVRIPKSIRGQELSYQELEEKAAELRQRLLEARLPAELLARIERAEAEVGGIPGGGVGVSGWVSGELRLRRHLSRLRGEVRGSGMRGESLHETLDYIEERAVLLRRIATLRTTKKLFDLWHVFHRPLAMVMLLVVLVHVATAIYFGYAFGGQ